jgi:glutamine synthetase
MTTSSANTGREKPETKRLSIPDIFGENVFSIKTMRNYLSEKAFASLVATICEGRTLDPGIADEVADAMKTWAVSRGATHYTHWFQPLTGATAEKHDSFVVPDRQGGALLQFSGKELIKGEPDASSFPSGGIRSTFEARGYTAWDPTSPAFIKESVNTSTLCIPTVFFGYHGESLDKKVPLLRSMDALSRQVCRLGKLFGIRAQGKRAYGTLGPEQEYFLIDRDFYNRRLDLLQTGRTLFGRKPAKHQQMEDHYFGSIKTRVMAFMEELDLELWRLGIPAKTRHNEVCPAQYEIAPTYEELNLAVDHNMLVMDMLRQVAERHGFICLLHEKPFAGVNGSGKHNNWAIAGPDGKNWLSPGENPREDAKFLTIICALMEAVDNRADVLRASVASARNDHRLGANEAPPAIMSIFLGDELTDIIEQIEKGESRGRKDGAVLHVGVSSLPRLAKDMTDRNRTSPFAFTGNKFEFRAVGSNQSCSFPMTVLNTIVAEALDRICTAFEQALARKKDFNSALEALMRDIIRKHKRILFNGDNYTAEWQAEAKRRGLANIKDTPSALKALEKSDVFAMFEKYNVLSRRELESRHEVFAHEYAKTVAIEAQCAATIARTMIVPAAIEYQETIGSSLAAMKAGGMKAAMKSTKALLARIAGEAEMLLAETANLEKAVAADAAPAMLAGMQAVRKHADELEGLVPQDLWPLPSYAEMLFMM